MSYPVGDFGYTVKELLEYLKGKGQIFSASQLASILLVANYIEKRYGVDLGLKEFVDSWVELSEIEASRWETVAQRNVEKVTRIGATINYVEEQGSRTKYLPFGRKKKE